MKTVIVLSAIALVALPLPAQLLAGDIILLTSSGLTHIRSNSAVAVTPVPMDANPLPTFWSDGSVEWVQGTPYVLAGSDFAPFGLYLLDFSTSLSSPGSYLLGNAVGGVRDMDTDASNGDVVVLENVSGGNGQARHLVAPISPMTNFNAAPTWATNLTYNNADYIALDIGATAAIIGGVANCQHVPAGSSTGGTALAFATWYYSCESMEIDQATGDLYVALFNTDNVRYLTGGNGTWVDGGDIMMLPEIDGPEDVEFDATTGQLYTVAREGGSIGGLAWGVQTGFDNAIIGNILSMTPPSGYIPYGPMAGHGNNGVFPNITVVGQIVATPAQAVVSGTGCAGTSGMPFALAANGLPQIGSTGFALQGSGGPPGGTGLLFLASATTPTPIPIAGSCSLYLDPVSLINFINLGVSPVGPLPLDGSGSTLLPLAVPPDPALIGLQFGLQLAAADAGAPGGLAVTNGLLLIFGT